MGEHIPHDQVVMFAQATGLRGFDLRIGRSEQIRTQKVISQFDIFEIAFEGHSPTLLMAVCMVTDTVSFGFDPFEKFRMHFGIFAEAEKGGFCVIFG